MKKRTSKAIKAGLVFAAAFVATVVIVATSDKWLPNKAQQRKHLGK